MSRFVCTWMLALAVATGCGGFENQPLRTGAVRGRVEGALTGESLVSVMGSPEVRSLVDSDGSFELRQVPAGSLELFIVANRSAALRFLLEVQGGRVAETGTLTPEPAAFLEVSVHAPSGQSLEGAWVTVVGTPYAKVSLDPEGYARVGPLASGCYGLELHAPGLGDQSFEECVQAGEGKDLERELPDPDGSEGHEGCQEAGCQQGLRCAPDGRCVECTENGHCGAGLACVDFRCQGALLACASCSEDWQCGSGGACVEVGEHEGKACAPPCVAGGCAEGGLTCQGGACLPDPALFDGCYARRQVGSACDEAEACVRRGIVGGLCVDSRCTYRCVDSEDCPDGYECAAVSGARVCRPK